MNSKLRLQDLPLGTILFDKRFNAFYVVLQLTEKSSTFLYLAANYKEIFTSYDEKGMWDNYINHANVLVIHA